MTSDLQDIPDDMPRSIKVTAPKNKEAALDTIQGFKDWLLDWVEEYNMAPFDRVIIQQSIDTFLSLVERCDH